MGIWGKVIMVAAYALVAFVGDWPLWMNASSAAVIGGVLFYLTYRERAGFSIEFVRGNLLYLVPGHVLLLLGLSLAGALGVRSWLLWVLLVLGTVVFDWVAQQQWPFVTRRNAVMGLYVLVWGSIFVLLHRLVASGGKLDDGGMTAFTAVLVLAALAYIGLALYRFTKLEPIEE